MTALWTSDEIAAAVGGAAQGEFDVSGVAFDSREVEPGHLFIALKGEATDGHRFLDKAFAAGAAGAIVSEAIDRPHVRVADTNAALDALGRAARARSSARICGVTGSAGKTGTKEALYAALDRAAPGEAHRSVKSYNNHVGVPLSLARMPSQTRFGVFEMGMNHAGELAALTRLVRPHVAIVTTIASAHREFFASDEAIADAKSEIFQGLEEGGIALVPNDSPHRNRLAAAARPYAAKVLSFGLGEGADIRARDIVPSPGGGSLVTAILPGAEITFTISQPGEHWVSNALAALAAVEAVGGDVAAAGLALADMGALKGRGERHRVAIEGGELLLIDESYNANPASMAATLKSLGAEAGVERRIAVLGPMRELGSHSDALHAGLAPAVIDARVDRLVLIGEEMKPLAAALAGEVEVERAADVDDAAEILLRITRPGDAVLVKASNSVGLAKLVERMVRQPLCST